MRSMFVMASKVLILCIVVSFQISKCVSSQDPGTRAITNGTMAKLRQYPYVVYLKHGPLESYKTTGKNCTGTILTELWVVTSAFSYRKYAKTNGSLNDVLTYVMAGTIDTSSPTSHTQERRSLRHIIMEKKDGPASDKFSKNILILRVCEPFIFNYYVGPLTLARRPLLEGKKMTCTMMGFGHTASKRLTELSKLHYTVGTMNGYKYSCRNLLNRPEVGEDLLCVRPVHYSSGPCNGDGGATLVCNGLGAGSLVGVQWRDGDQTGCGLDGSIYVFTFLGFHEDWLRRYIPELPAARWVKDGPAKKRDTSGGGDTRFRVADIGLLVFFDCILRWGILQP